MEDQELRDIIREELEAARPPQTVAVNDAVRLAVKETLITLGMDATNPLGLQQDMAFIRDLREGTEKIKARGLFVLVGLLVTAAVTAVWLGIKASLGTP